MDTLIVFSAIKTLLICVLGTVFLAFGAQRGFSYFNFKGRMNRLQFTLCFFSACIALGLLTSLVEAAYQAVEILPGYWAIQIGAFLAHIILFPFFLVPLIGRFRDFNLFAVPAFIIAAFIMYTANYNFLPSTEVLVYGLLFILILVLLVIPGSHLPNKYGRPSLWPYKTEKNPFKSKPGPKCNR